MDSRTKEVLRLLCGEWKGQGEGAYPDIAPFRFLEETSIAFEPDWTMLCVRQRTWRIEGGARGKGLHLESGILQAREDGSLLYSCGQDAGRTEVMRGSIAWDDAAVRIDWTTVAHGFDDRLVKAGRTWWVEARVFRYEAFLSTARTPEYRRHLEARLAR